MCDFPGCSRPVYANGFCINHNRFFGPKDVKKTEGIKPISDKRRAQDKEYVPKKKAFLKQHTQCQIQSPECTDKATDIHHTRGREGHNYLDETTWMPTCRRCNTYVEQNDAWARERGFKRSKHQIINK